MSKASADVPAALTARLRVTASHERSRRLARLDFAARVRDWRSHVRLRFDNMMRPFAVPVTGGLFSAVLLFSILVPKLTFVRSTTYEPPIDALADAPAIFVSGPEGEIVGASPGVKLVRGNAMISGNEVSLVLWIDEHGAVQDWNLSEGEMDA